MCACTPIPNSRAGLGVVTLGPAASLRPVYERRYFIQTILPQLCNIVVASMGLFALALWWRRRTEPTYVLFFVFSVLWALPARRICSCATSRSPHFMDIWVQSSFGWCAALHRAGDALLGAALAGAAKYGVSEVDL